MSLSWRSDRNCKFFCCVSPEHRAEIVDRIAVELSDENTITEETIKFLKTKIKNFDIKNRKHEQIFYLIYLYLSFVKNFQNNSNTQHRLYGAKDFLKKFFEKHKAEFRQPKSFERLQYELEIGHKLYLALGRLKNLKISDQG